MENEAIIEIIELAKVYGMGEVQVRALDEVSLTIRKGNCGHHGTFWIREEHADEYPGLP